MLAKPDCTFSIPSLYDGLELDGRLYFPRRQLRSFERAIAGFAIVAHPYAPLGGCWDDPVVQVISSSLLKAGFVVNTFNFRGAAGSAGSTSWTGNAELADYVTMLVHLLQFIDAPNVMHHVRSKLIVLGGYSYGSMIASCLPDIDVAQHYKSKEADARMADITDRAVKLSKSFLSFIEAQHEDPFHGTQPSASPPSPRGFVLGGHEPDSISKHPHRESFRKSLESVSIRRSIEKVKHKLSVGEDDRIDIREASLNTTATTIEVAFLLVSPILPPIASFITLFSRPSFDHGPKRKARDHDQQRQNLTQNLSLLCFGSKDTFTSSHKLKKWAHDLAAVPGARISAQGINEAGHFWREPGVERRLQLEISAWLSQVVEKIQIKE